MILPGIIRIPLRVVDVFCLLGNALHQHNCYSSPWPLTNRKVYTEALLGNFKFMSGVAMCLCPYHINRLN